MPETGTPERGRWMAAIGEMGMVAGLLTLTGWALPLAWGWLVPCVLVVALVMIHEQRHRGLRGVDLPGVLARQPMAHKASVLMLTLVPAAIFVTVALRGLGSVLVAYPAAWWSLGAALVFAVASYRVQTPRVRAPIMVLGLVVVCVAAVFGTRYEEAGEDARGWAYSGPIHGIHPFQSTSVLVDGYGPFDLPINDYVEPDGSRGYSPEALADAMGQAMRSIGEVHFADGPARARQAFVEAQTGFVMDPPIRERLDKDPPTQDSPRFYVRSGTHGQRSSVQFVCPGRRDDPRGLIPDNVMNRMCPSKYSAEGSAGLGVTGRWPGYAEARGNERVGISRWMGWTRSDDPKGRQRVRTEIEWSVWALVLLVGALVLRRRQAVAASLGSLGGMTALGVVVVLFLGVFASGASSIGFAPIQSATPGASAWSLAPWLPAIAVFGGVAGYRRLVGAGTGRDEPGDAPSWWRRLGFASVIVATAGVAAHLSTLSWTVPDLYGVDDGELALQRFVGGAADAIGPRLGLDILEIEGVVAGVIVVLLLTLSVGAARTLRACAGAVVGHDSKREPWAVLVTIAVFVALVFALTVSRKTEGASTLLGGALGLTLVLSSSLHRLVAPVRSGSRALFGRIAHVWWIAVGIGAVLDSASRSPRPDHRFVIACTVVGVVCALSAVVFLRSAESSSDA